MFVNFCNFVFCAHPFCFCSKMHLESFVGYTVHISMIHFASYMPIFTELSVYDPVITIIFLVIELLVYSFEKHYKCGTYMY